MPDLLFDTTVFVDDYNDNPAAAAAVADVLLGQKRAFYSPVTVFELWLHEMARDEEARHRALLGACISAPFNDDAARVMSSWLSLQPRSGRRRLLGDAMIAATAAALGLTILTRNPRDFTRFYANVQSY